MLGHILASFRQISFKESKMPLPMVHLAIAVQLQPVWEPSLTSDFLLGSLAPDAIHMRPNTDRSDKKRTHFGYSLDAADLELLQDQLVSRWASDNPMMNFVEGYIAHILTDRLWLQTVVENFRSRLPFGLSMEDQRSLYYQETDQIDFNLFYHEPWRPRIWSQLRTAQAVDFEELLTAAEIAGWRDRTLVWFDQQQEPMVTPIYLTEADVREFIPQAAETIGGYLAAWKSAIQYEA
jgi:hypothetical protein